MIRTTGANKLNGYLLGSYRIATAPELNSSLLTSFKSTSCDSPANNVAPWPASPGVHNELVLIDQSQLRQRQWKYQASREQSLTRLLLEPLNGASQNPRDELRVPIDPVQVLDIMNFFAESMVQRVFRPFRPSNQAARLAGLPPPCLHHFKVTRPKRRASAWETFSIA